MASALLMGACAGQSGVSLVAPAPVDSAALSIFVARETSLVAYRARDGSTRWTYNTAGEDYDLDYGIEYGDGLVLGFTFSNSHPDHLTLVAVDAANGHLRWSVRVAGLYRAQVAMANNYVILEPEGPPGPLRVIRASDGAEVRDIPLAGGGQIAADGDTAFECAPTGALTAFRLPDGKPVWTVSIMSGLPGAESGCGLSASDGIVFGSVTISVSIGRQMNEVVAMRASDGRRLWQKPRGLDLFTSGRGYFFVTPASELPGQDPTARSVVAYRVADGAILWQIPVSAEDTVNLAGDGNILALHQGADVRVIRASDGASLWRYAHPADHSLGVVDVAGGLVFALSTGAWSVHHPAPFGADTRDHLLALGARDGRLYWQMPLDLSSIAIGGAT